MSELIIERLHTVWEIEIERSSLSFLPVCGDALSIYLTCFISHKIHGYCLMKS